MTTDEIEKLANRLAAALCPPDDPRCSAGALLFPAILRILAEGLPASTDLVGQAIGLPPDLAAATISHVFPDAELDPDGRLVGLGLSLVTTPHVVRLRGRDRTLYAWCALDALLLPALLDENAQVTSSCHTTGQEITVLLGPEDVEEVRPPSAVASFVTEIDPLDRRASGCGNQHFFSSVEAAAPWLAEHAQAFTLPVADAFRMLDRLGRQALGETTRGAVDTGEVMARLMVGYVVDELPSRLITKNGDLFSTASGQPEPGNMWWDSDLSGRLDSELHRERGGGPHLVVRLPNDWDWDIDGPMSNGPGWHRISKPPNVTAVPSVVAGEYHGFLLKGRLMHMRETS